jgi:hypothetical protein
MKIEPGASSYIAAGRNADHAQLHTTEECIPREELKMHKNQKKTIKIDLFFILQGCYCERLITPGNGQAGSKQGRDGDEKLVRIPLSPTLYIF